ncbi:MAG TPA: hypothetical protein VFC28_10545 [Opitutaceae bacterium]|nr:hypothetical protein [Opitutaceae bacterium]
MKRSCHSSPGLGLLLVFGLQFLVLNLSAAAALDLGQNLTYLRLHGRPDDVPNLTAVWGKPALIIDLRYPGADAARYLPADLPPRPAPAPLFVLVGPATPLDALAALRRRAPALITLGLPAPGLAPDIALVVKPEDDRRADEALDSGVPVESLLSETVAKRRFDEAALIHERAQGPDAAGTTAVDAVAAATAPPAKPDHPAAAAAPPAEPKDAILQRAVQLYRTLMTLGKLPRR